MFAVHQGLTKMGREGGERSHTLTHTCTAHAHTHTHRAFGGGSHDFNDADYM